jgi:choline dehydrogenase-like flavoprotein
MQYLTQKKGLLTSNAAEAGGFAASRYGSAEKPDLQFHFIPGLIVDHGRQLAFDYGFSLHVCHLYPTSTGSIRLASKSPYDAPNIDPNYLSDEADLYALVDGVRLARQIFTAPEFTHYGLSPWYPIASSLDEELSDEAIIDFIRERAETVYHPVGTCRMGSVDDPNTVVDPDCRVKYVTRLRVVDASVMPKIMGGNTNAPTIMIAEKIAANIIAEL